MRWIAWLIAAYLLIGVIVAIVLLRSADHQWSIRSVGLFAFIVIAWPLWILFLIAWNRAGL